MTRQVVTILLITIFLSFLTCLRPSTTVDVKASNGYPVHNVNSGLNYTTIQEAIDALETLEGHTIFVEKGIYYEHLVVNKPLSLIGEDRFSTIIDGNYTGNVTVIASSSVKIVGFTIQRSGKVYTVDNCSYGICFQWGISGCNVSHNILTDNLNGIWLYNSNANTIYGNNITNNGWDGIALEQSLGNCIHGNNIMSNNYRGVNLFSSSNNSIYHNNFIDNSQQAHSYDPVNAWDNGIEGNYWSDYDGIDASSDGIGDVQYTIDANNTDNYPLMGMFHSYNVSLIEVGFTVTLVSNSTVSNFDVMLDLEHPFNWIITFRVAGDSEFGFCRICIPHALMYEPCQVIIDDGLTEVLCFNETIYDNGTHRWIYFAYQHSTHTVIIIPEFPLFLILPLFMIATLVTVIVYKRKYH